MTATDGSDHKQTREQAMVGLFVLIIAGLLIAVLLMLSGYRYGGQHSYRTYFENAAGLAPGRPVRFGGIDVGRVEQVRVDPQRSDRIEVMMSIDSGIAVRTDSVARIDSLGALGDNYLAISTGSHDSPRLAAGDTIASAPYVGFSEMLIEISSLVPQVEQLLDDIGNVVGEVRSVVGPENRAHLAAALVDFRGTITTVRPDIEAAAANLRLFSEDLEPIIVDLRKLSDESRRAVGTASEMLVENRPDVRQATADLRRTLEDLQQLAGSLRRAVLANAVPADEAIENLRLASDNLRRFTEQLADNPAVMVRGVRRSERRPGQPPPGPTER